MKQEIEQAIKRIRQFTGNATVTKHDVAHIIMSDRHIFTKTFKEIDNETFRERGCAAIGGCACTGACHELVPINDLDRMQQAFYLKMQETILDEIERGEYVL